MSQTQSVVSSDTFEALVDLLASDGVDQHPSPCGTRPQANVTLRDPSGKLDFDKIRVMFASQNGSRSLGEQTNRVQSLQVSSQLNDEGDSDGEPHPQRSAPSTVPSRANSMSPGPVEQTTTGHRRSSTFGDQPWVAAHESMTAKDVHQPLSLDELNTALADAQQEVKSLRQQYGQLQALVSKRLGTDARNQAKLAPGVKIIPDKSNGHAETRDTDSHVVPSTNLPPDVPTEIASLSEDEAKRALSALVQSLNLSSSVIGTMVRYSAPDPPTSPQHRLSPSLTRQHDVDSIVRAVKFLGTVDELVWRRTSNPSGPRTLLPVYSEENNVALLARLELWERAVRRSARF